MVNKILSYVIGFHFCSHVTAKRNFFTLPLKIKYNEVRPCEEGGQDTRHPVRSCCWGLANIIPARSTQNLSVQYFWNMMSLCPSSC